MLGDGLVIVEQVILDVDPLHTEVVQEVGEDERRVRDQVCDVSSADFLREGRVTRESDIVDELERFVVVIVPI